MASKRSALLTGFEPYAGRGLNPAAEIVKQLSGTEIGSYEIVGRVLPVAYQGLAQAVRQLLAEVDPAFVINLGLAPGTPTIRIERVAVNVADFEIPDNAGETCLDQAIVENGSQALFSSLPIRAIEQRLLEQGIPVNVSDTAGTYLCNATMYCFLHTLAELDKQSVPSGFVHLPYLPEQVAEVIAATGSSRLIELHQRSDLASMHLETMVTAVRLALEVTCQDVDMGFSFL